MPRKNRRKRNKFVINSSWDYYSEDPEEETCLTCCGEEQEGETCLTCCGGEQEETCHKDKPGAACLTYYEENSEEETCLTYYEENPEEETCLTYYEEEEEEATFCSPESEEEYELTPELLKSWETYWAANGEQLIWASWIEKYKDYINPEFDLVDRLKNMPVCSDSSSSDDEAPEEMTTRRPPRSSSHGASESRFKRTRTASPIIFEDEDEDEASETEQKDSTLNLSSSEGETAVNVSSSEGETAGTSVLNSSTEAETTGTCLDASLLESSTDERAKAKAWDDKFDEHCKEVCITEQTKFIKKRANKRKRNRQSYPPSLSRNYYNQRYLLFSRYDEGILLDEESWYSVTPEKIAEHIAEKCKKDKYSTVIDAFCGCGGNTIQFAMKFDHVIAIDIDPKKIEMCKHNAKLYKVQDKIEFIVGDFMKLAPGLQADVVFLSPPWGGVGYQKYEKFDIEEQIPMDGFKLFDVANSISPNIAYFLPRNVDQEQVIKCAGEGNKVEIERNNFRGDLKTITAYYGELVRDNLKLKTK